VNIDFSASIETIDGIGPARAKFFYNLGLKTIDDLLYHFPRRYKDLTQPKIIGCPRFNEEVVVEATVEDIKIERTKNRRLTVTVGTLRNDNQIIVAIWFNQPFINRVIYRGQQYVFYGKIGRRWRDLNYPTLMNPAFESSRQILPIYPASAKLTNRQLRMAITKVIDRAREYPDPLPQNVIKAENLMPLGQALWQVHRPGSFTLLAQAQRRLAFNEVLGLARRFIEIDRDYHKQEAQSFSSDILEIKTLVRNLPFRLTEDQRIAAWRIIKGMESEAATLPPLNCLLNGDVGSGKTIVALLASLSILATHYNVVWMAPTAILAEQHYQNIKRLLPKRYQSSLLLVTASKNELKMVNNIKGHMLIGTHALLYDTNKITNIGLVVIDEQHRFGVEQRRKLLTIKQELVPHFLSMTATPIPRTLALLVGSNMELVTIKEKPVNRKPIITSIIAEEGRPTLYQRIREELEADRQIYVIAPLIEESEEGSETLFGRDKKSVESTAKEYEAVFSQYSIATLNGRMKATEKDQIMSDFTRGKINILISTTVIEVGIDVANASVMVIEGANHFGLAQLHQLRGRVGRSELQSYCYLTVKDNNLSPTAQSRLQIMTQTNDGFKIAQKDLELRGPGDFFGVDQSGFMDLKLANLADVDLIEKARNVATKLYGVSAGKS